MRRLPWIFACSLGVIAWACNETFPAELAPHPPSVVFDDDAGDAGGGGDGGDGAAAIVAKGSRTLGVEVQIDALDFPDRVAAIADAGARTTNASFTWDAVERPDDAGGTTISNAGVHIVNLVLADSKVHVAFAIAAVDATGPRAPADLAGRAIDDAQVLARYDKVIDYAFDQLRDVVVDVFLVAVDVDQTLGASAAKWAAFTGFVDHAASHAHAVRPGAKIGFVISAKALVAEQGLAGAALRASDVVVVSDPSSFDAIAAAAPAGKPVFVHRIALDAGDAFGQWDRHVDRIPIVTFPAVTDDLVREARARGF